MSAHVRESPMFVVARVICLIAMVLLAGCDSDGIHAPPRGLPHAVAARSCAPNDGPAVAIYLTSTAVQTLQPSTPYLRVAVWQPLDGLRGRSWSLASGSSVGAAWFHSTATTFEIATRGSVTVTAVSADNRVEGNMDVTFPRAGRIRGGFKATWIAQTMLCG